MLKRRSILLKVIALFWAITILSCSPQQRLAALVKRHPELIKHDTIFKVDTFKISEVRKDTVFYNQVTRDTVVIKQDHLTIKYFNSRDSIFISGKCDSIIKIVRVPVEINTVEAQAQTGWNKFWNSAKDYLIVALLGAIIVLMILMKKKIL
jgi:hypothetical protein